MPDALQDIKSLTDRFIAESLKDPDLILKSDDYKAGYERGFREAVWAFVNRLNGQKK